MFVHRLNWVQCARTTERCPLCVRRRRRRSAVSASSVLSPSYWSIYAVDSSLYQLCNLIIIHFNLCVYFTAPRIRHVAIKTVFLLISSPPTSKHPLSPAFPQLAPSVAQSVLFSLIPASVLLSILCSYLFSIADRTRIFSILERVLLSCRTIFASNKRIVAILDLLVARALLSIRLPTSVCKVFSRPVHTHFYSVSPN